MKRGAYARLGDAVHQAPALGYSDAGIPTSSQQDSTFADAEDTVKFLTMHSCKGLEFPWVAIPGTRLMSKDGRISDEDAKLLYVAMTRATHQLLVFQ